MLLTVLFALLMFSVFGKICWIAFKATWGLAKVLLTIVFLPIILIGMFISGLVAIAFPLLILIGIAALIGPKRAGV